MLFYWWKFSLSENAWFLGTHKLIYLWLMFFNYTTKKDIWALSISIFNLYRFLHQRRFKSFPLMCREVVHIGGLHYCTEKGDQKLLVFLHYRPEIIGMMLNQKLQSCLRMGSSQLSSLCSASEISVVISHKWCHVCTPAPLELAQVFLARFCVES